MTTIVTIEKRLCIDPTFLGKNLHRKLFEFLKESTKNECTKENGYVIDIKRIKQIKNNYISGNNCEIIFELDIDAEILKPEINKIFTDKVCMLFSGGVFIDIQNKFKVLIPLSSLYNFIFDQELKLFKNEITSVIIQENDSVNVKITGIKFAKNNFSCFGELSSTSI